MAGDRAWRGDRACWCHGHSRLLPAGLFRSRAIRSSRTGSASSASAISAGRRWRSGSCARSWPRPGLAGKVVVDSAGTGDWHLGEAMDSRASAELSRRGYDGSGHEARQIQRHWLADYDLLLAMDLANLASLAAMAAATDELAGRIQLMRSFDPAAADDAEVPDPYYGSPADYAEVFELVEAAARGLASQLCWPSSSRSRPDGGPGDRRARLAQLLDCDLVAAQQPWRPARRPALPARSWPTAVRRSPKFRTAMQPGTGPSGPAVDYRAAAAQARADGTAAGFAAEAAGLRWLAAAERCPFPLFWLVTRAA